MIYLKPRTNPTFTNFSDIIKYVAASGRNRNEHKKMGSSYIISEKWIKSNRFIDVSLYLYLYPYLYLDTVHERLGVELQALLTRGAAVQGNLVAKNIGTLNKKMERTKYF